MNLELTANVPLMQVEGSSGIRFKGTRVSLDTVIYYFNHGETAETIVDCFSTLNLTDVRAVLAFYLENRLAVEAYVGEREEEADRLRQAIESQPGYSQRRERIRQRRADHRRI